MVLKSSSLVSSQDQQDGRFIPDFSETVHEGQGEKMVRYFEFCNLVIRNPNSAGMKPAEAIQRLISLNPEYYDESALQALMKIFSIPV